MNAIDRDTVAFSVWQKLQKAGLLLIDPEYVERVISWGHRHRRLSAEIVRFIEDDVRVCDYEIGD